MSGTASLVLIALVFCLLIFRNQIRIYLMRCLEKTAEAALRDSGKCCGCGGPVFACDSGMARDHAISFKIPSAKIPSSDQPFEQLSFCDDESNNAGSNAGVSSSIGDVSDCDRSGFKKASYFVYSAPLDIDECMNSNKDCDITYKNVHTSFEHFSKKIVSSVASNDDSNCVHIRHPKYEPAIEQDADSDPDDLA